MIDEYQDIHSVSLAQAYACSKGYREIDAVQSQNLTPKVLTFQKRFKRKYLRIDSLMIVVVLMFGILPFLTGRSITVKLSPTRL